MPILILTYKSGKVGGAVDSCQDIRGEKRVLLPSFVDLVKRIFNRVEGLVLEKELSDAYDKETH